MKKLVFFFLALIIFGVDLKAQVSINAENSLPDSSAMLDVKSTNRGMLIPRISTTVRDILPSPATGLLIYNTSTNRFNYYNGSFWYQLETTFLTPTIGTFRPGGGVSINASPGAVPDSSAMLDVNNPTRGILIPGTTPDSIPSPATGLMIYNTSTNLLNYYNGAQWIALCAITTGIIGAGGSQAIIGVAINGDNAGPHPSAMLDVSARTRGILIPRLSDAQRDMILPVTGLVIYNTTANAIEFYSGSAWYMLIPDLLLPPTPGIHVPAGGWIAWKWDAVAGATGYRWNTVNNYATAMDMGAVASKTESFLTCNSSYARFVWAYNICGYSSPLTLTQSTLGCFPCGSTLTVNHVEGETAPVTKTVSYGTVTGIPGEPNKCWIASNLGAGHQATAVNDTTEASAGWYWQFNRKQGFKHNGTSRLPNTEWITINTENTNWDAAKDPCSLELGPDWHIPTLTEWEHVDAAGNWYSWLGPWNSGLKLHAAGYLNDSRGLLTNRGSNGYNWSSSDEISDSVLYDNGPMANSIGTGFGGADESTFQEPLTNFGSSINQGINCRIADDFTVGGNQWNVTFIEFYGYQTGSTTTSTFTAAYCRILNGTPGQPGTTVVWGDTTTNRLSSTSFTNIYRVQTGGEGNIQRPVMKIVINTADLILPAGNYWIEFSALGTLTSGPWSPYITINNTLVTGNALQYYEGAYSSLYSGSNMEYHQGIPFKIKGTQSSARYGWALGFAANPSSVGTYNKTGGFPVRCIKDCAFAPNAPSSGIQIPGQGQIVWNWNVVPGATGYKWNTVNDFMSATDMSGLTTKADTGLSCNSICTRYVWAYNGCGVSPVLTLTQSTAACIVPCGTPVTVNHVAGSVAPVTKTVTYGTIANIPGEPGKCWITRNLGASQQATAVSDATEPSAGWYWQFNRKQGYKHDGTTRTPNTTWISVISENLYWQAANDPCATELGNGWRLATFTEWNNVKISGSWTNWTNPWNSALKLHAAGFLNGSNGLLTSRAVEGRNWSSTQYLPSMGYTLYFNASNCFATNYEKQYGYPVRCIKDSPNPVLPTVTTAVVTNIGQNTATSGGNVTSDGGAKVTARGVCWSVSPNPAITGSHTTDAAENGVFESTLTGLSPNTLYYVKAYATNTIGTSYGNEFTFTTFAALTTCPGSATLTINHVTSGGAAPVSKTVTYGTVSNLPGEPSKCWITRNLGASQQATTVNDATELSAGWYWQFNRKQGYKHDGTTRTPATTWITAISENLDWQIANDPCKNELGTGWRVPTKTEWTNVVAAGKWSNWNGPWNSGMRIHVAGNLNSTSGILSYRGVFGQYWSSVQEVITNGWSLYISSANSGVIATEKASGFPVRCIKDSPNAVAPTVSTTTFSNITQTSATSGGNVTSDGGAIVTARGVCWGISANPVITGNHTTNGSMNGLFASVLSGLAPNTPYHVRAYATNSAGTSYGNDLTFTTFLHVTPCPGIATVTVNHLVSGGVSPVNKTVMYATSTNIPGEPSKCWIAGNLGSDHQATAVNDTTEASAGWYWQFNRKQGYKVYGTARTPNTTWITSINENLEWQAANDPCALELGSTWRIPTSTEWNNVDATGNWSTWDGPWNCGLRLHAAGYLRYSNYGGELTSRGSNGVFWGSAQSGSINGLNLNFYNNNSFMSSNKKAYGFSVRCIGEAPIPSTVPVVTTAPVSNITQTTVISGGNVTSNGGVHVFARGVCWSTSTNPTTANSHTINGSGTGLFVSNIMGLLPNTTYFMRAYATNNVGTAYGDQVSFPTQNFDCGQPYPDSRDGKSYNTVLIGTQCWMAQNLNVGVKINGPLNQTDNDTIEKYCYNDDESNCTVYGGLYQWNEMMRSSGSIPYLLLNESFETGDGTTPPSGWVIEQVTGTVPGISFVTSSSAFPTVNAAFDGAKFVKYYAIGISIGSTRLKGTTALSTSNKSSITVGFAWYEDAGYATSADRVEVQWSTDGTTWHTEGTFNRYNAVTGWKEKSVILPGEVENQPALYIAFLFTSAHGNNCSLDNVRVTGQLSGGICPAGWHLPGDGDWAVLTTYLGGETQAGGKMKEAGVLHWTSPNTGASNTSGFMALPGGSRLLTGVFGNLQTDANFWSSSETTGGSWSRNLQNTSGSINRNAENKVNGFSVRCIREISPAVTTTSATNVTQTSAATGGNITADGGAFITARGVCWGTSANPTTSGNHTLDGYGSGIFVSNLTGLLPNTTYYVRAYATNYIGTSYGNEIFFTTLPPVLPVVTTTAVTNVYQTSAVSGGNVSFDGGISVSARGVCWSTSSNPSLADNYTTDGNGTGMFMSSITGLIPDTLYFLRAYATNIVGTAYGNEYTFSTLSDSMCGSTVTVNHLAGNVAPVSKTVTYGIVSNIPGEPLKCWITSNLGADHQATAVNDITEASAGWYWQYNRKQGYMHDGIHRTPNTSWITSIIENLDWQTANDPCVSELGNGWRIPSHTEWTNASAGGVWTNWYGPWNSGLKLHAAGNLDWNNGLLNGRGSYGYYWIGRTQMTTSNFSWCLNFYSSHSSMNDFNKSSGLPLRCIKDSPYSALPTVNTTNVSNISQTTATGGGNVTSDGGGFIAARGVCWSTFTNPTTSDNHTTDGSGTGTFVSNLTGLSPSTLYFVRAYAVNNSGTAYGNQVSFISANLGCNQPITDARDGKTYSTVLIGNQCWMAQNLNVGVKTSGSLNQTNNDTIEKYCYNNDEANCTIYGGLYQWDEMMRSSTTLPVNLLMESFESGSGATPPTGWVVEQVSGTVPGITFVTSSTGPVVSAAYDATKFVSYNSFNIASGSSTRLKRTTAISTIGKTSVTVDFAWYENNGYSGNAEKVDLQWSTNGTTWNTAGTFYRYNLITGWKIKTVLLPTSVNNISTLYIGFLFTSAWGHNCSLDYVKVTGQISGGICPTGWHVPSDAEYTTLTTYLGGESVAGGKLKETGYDHWVYPNTGATNTSGFNALPGGGRLTTVTFGNLLTDANFWTSTVSSTTSWRRNLLYSAASVARTAENKSFGYSLRCLGEFPPTITTVSPSNILRFSATSGGNVSADGGAIVTARGVCWSTSMTPTTADNHSMDGIGTGSFPSAITGLTANTAYYIRAFATNSSGTSYGNEFSFTTLPPLAPIVTTISATNISHNAASSGGNVTDDGGATVLERGVCWGKSANPSLTDSHTTDGGGTGSFASNLNGLTPDTVYHIRAYATNIAGTAYGNEVTFTTFTDVYPCPGVAAITVNHRDTGGVAPVNKTVTYGTVANIPGEPLKCWITSNLGSDHQATAVDDSTEASAGWYWQYNRKQGYKHDGTALTPNTAWLTTINENLDWQPANDPCALELGNGWRIPVYSEWTNVDAGGSWNSWNGPWNSGLKLHAAGELQGETGQPMSRGNKGYFWAVNSPPCGSDCSWGFYFSPGGSSTNFETLKTTGLSLRCIKDSPNSILPSVTTTTVTNITQTTATTGGNVTSDGGALITARGFCWSTSLNPTIADSHTTDGYGTGTFSTSLTGLTPNTLYYGRAYATNGAGTGYGSEVYFFTLESCASYMTINHVAGAVAPVAKTVSYGIVTNIPGEPLKCWITRNLGASQQAATVSETTEPSAGWYWQFNRKQGFKHDGTTRTPNTAWITSISENYDWLAANDPCTIELGGNWRVPTYTEWMNVDASGSWTTWTGPWNSALKIHAAGYLSSNAGSVTSRGSLGYYWSSKQYSTTNGYTLSISSSSSGAGSYSKAYGSSVRCIKEPLPVAAIPTVTTSPVSNITQISALSGGNVTSHGGAAVTSRGVCWSTSINPSIANSRTYDGTGTGSFVTNISGLLPNTTYYVRAYALNSAGTGYGSQVSFTTQYFDCGQPYPDARDGKTYNTVLIGSQCWMAQNLDFGKKINGSLNQTSNDTVEKYCYDNDESNCAIYGGLYQWDEISRSTANVSSLLLNESFETGDGTTPPAGWTIEQVTGISPGISFVSSGAYPTVTAAYEGAKFVRYSSFNISSGTTRLKSDPISTIGKSSITIGFAWYEDPGYSTSMDKVYVQWSTNGTTWNIAGDFNRYSPVAGWKLKNVALPPGAGNQAALYIGFLFETAYGNNCSLDYVRVNVLVSGGICPAGWHLPNDGEWNVITTFLGGEAVSGGKMKEAGYARWSSPNTGATNSSGFTALAGGSRLVGGTFGNLLTDAGFWSSNDTTTGAWARKLQYSGESLIRSAENKNSGLSLRCVREISPTVSTTQATNIIQVSATIGGNITADGGAFVTGRGVCWGTSANPEIAGNHTHNGSGSGIFVSNLTGLAPGTTYYVRAYATNSIGTSYGNEISFTTPDPVVPTVTTTAVTNIHQASAVSGGNITYNGGATVSTRGVCWSYSSNPTLADNHTTDGTGNGTFISSFTGLSPDTLYFVRAYATNSAGTGYGNEVTFTTLSDTICGASITVSHVAGTVAPVNKTVTYGLVSNIPGEPLKCWITSNLGADHQATAVNDTSEAPAGWYWQFNRKQGYKHDGTTRTPNTIWITAINENLDWQPANDPCTIELGNGWRIPSYTEWTNVKTTGGWENGNGMWNSGLKIHAAGRLDWGNNGLLNGRGSSITYWSVTQISVEHGRSLYFNSPDSILAHKSCGFPLRCIKDSPYSVVPTVNTTTVTSVAQTTVTSGGNVTDDGGAFIVARGVCWSLSSNPTIAGSHTSDGIGTGTFVSNPTGLSPNSLYYLRSYATNIAGTGYGNELTFYTAVPCSSSVIVDHVEGNIAPVSKTVTYGIVTNIPGEPSKCWITKNLGASQQATAVSDATEASAGWYWEFNRKQGYKHDGTIRTPASPWITPISENLDWQSGNDPCALELGSGWRIPTSTEWTNVITTGAWANWNGPWASNLKMHAAGNLTYGSLSTRGSYGYYWSSTQNTIDNGSSLYFYSGYCSIFNGMKPYGFPLRCIQDVAGGPKAPTVISVALTNTAQTTATSGGNVTSDGGASVTARGVCWGTASNPTTANSFTSDGAGTGIFVSNITGLSPNVQYFLRAYATNSVGTSYSKELSLITLPVSTCGSITINHVAGTVAPVSKTVTYGTVTNLPGEPTKCWITGNLGADRQATAVTDATEASAGWYWQFNRKQGYKHDGTTRTPNTTWLTSISENLSWQTTNDPCAIELGGGWRIPTSTEWTNVDAGGTWTTWDGPWNSGLRLHASGYLLNTNGTLTQRGGSANYWGSSQYSTSATSGWALFFNPGECYNSSQTKAVGLSLRCINNAGGSVTPTVTTSPATNLGQNSATSGGNVTSDGGTAVAARGVCWNTSPNPLVTGNHTTEGGGMGIFSTTLTGLLSNTTYYARAYATNTLGTAYGNEISFTTLSVSSCGSSITVSHLAGIVAPVNKTVSYGIVTNIPGEPAKCWITQNLGATQQATAVNDATELSAGWYWQFNLKQGYMHDGTTRTPNTTWLNSISETSDWLASNDPCASELGNGWRVPTSTEWNNVNDIGIWIDWDGPWNSALKLHAAGQLNSANGSLNSRGSGGYYWSSSQYDAGYSWNLHFYNGGSEASIVKKASGFSVRCIRN